MVWAAISWYSILLVPLLPSMVELQQEECGQVGYSGTSHVCIRGGP
jgi:hypothetical protein